MLRDLHAICAALEPARARRAPHPVFAAACLPSLGRADALAGDPLVRHGAEGAGTFELRLSRLHDVRHLHAIEATPPERLLAPACGRDLGDLGDLSGGPMPRRSLAASMEQPLAHAAGCGTAYCDFGDAASPQALTLAWRAGLGGVVGDNSGADASLAEARLAIEWHLRRFDELTPASGLADPPPALSKAQT